MDKEKTVKTILKRVRMDGYLQPVLIESVEVENLKKGNENLNK